MPERPLAKVIEMPRPKARPEPKTPPKEPIVVVNVRLKAVKYA
jgi:hypothetical protein